LAGSVFNFDVWSTYSGQNSAYDALQNPSQTFSGTADLPYGSNGNPPAPYDSATATDSLFNSRTYTISSSVIASTWTGASGANWSDAGNWTAGVPNGVGHAASFDGSGPTSVNIDGPQTVGSLTLAGTSGYTLGGAGPLTFDAASGPATLSVSTGSHSVAAPVVLADDLTLSVASGSAVSLGGSVTATGRTITKEGAGSAQFENLRAASFNLAAGVVRMSQKGSANAEAGTSVLQSLSIASGAELDLKNNALVLDYAAGPAGTLLADVRAHLLAGRLTTTSAANRRLGYLDNAVGVTRASFGGVEIDASSVLIGYALPGDTDLSGAVDFSDLLSLAQNYGASDRVWSAGDFDYTGVIDFNDLLLLAQNYGTSGFVAGNFESDWALARSIVPEPTALGLVASAGLGLLKRRR
jgi:hypothetical protein